MSTTLERIRSRRQQQEAKLNRLQDRLVVTAELNIPAHETAARVALLFEEVSWLRQQENILLGQEQDVRQFDNAIAKTVPLRGGRSKWA
ncbi:hypothetical protein LLE49_19320 [Alicyclobacillus tolerans]|uniref:hypothetical protein n=1 Tax=Alicyclobacillus tolerans TaxID=90970 RepID=UPI001F426B3D|nr:hypothetical protein [Alicyclobacillus tolerans]MCF8566874.1 hypothetical protein [Alicyclobacillus tolerans]